MKETGITAIIGAMESEIATLRELLEDSETLSWSSFTFYRGTLEGNQVVIVRSGVGKVLSAMITQQLLSLYSPTRVLFTGIAGALTPELEIGDVLIAKDAVQHDLDATPLGFERGLIPYTDYKVFPCDEKLIKLMSDYVPEEDHAVHYGRVLTGDQFITAAQRESHAYLTEELAGNAVEMEGASVAAVCHINAVPCFIMRTISDKADDSAHVDFETFLPLASKNSVRAIQHLLRAL